MAAVTVDITRIRLDGGTQIRESLYDKATLDEYFDAAEAGATFPPIHVVDDGNSLWLVDGFHRHAVAIRRGQRTIDAHIREGTLEEAQWLACAANRGLARTHADKRAAVLAALRHPRSKGKGDRAIAAHCGVDHKTVGAVRRTLTENMENLEVGNFPSSKIEAGSGKKLTEKGHVATGHSPVAKARKDKAFEDAQQPAKPIPPVQPVADEEADDDGFDGYDAELEDDVAAEPEPAKIEKPAVLCDHQGREVPRCLVHKWVLLTRQYELTAATIVAAKNQGGQHRAALTRASKTITDGALVRHGDLDGWSLGRALKQAELSLERLRPWVVCPECDGTGGEHPSYCNYCGASGWLCPEDFERRVDAVRARTGKRGAR
jgi:hypothetical protein